MQEIGRNVAFRGTGDSVTTIGAAGLTIRISSTRRAMFSSFSATVLSRETCRSASKTDSGIPRQNTPPVSRSSQTSASPSVNTNAPASASAWR